MTGFSTENFWARNSFDILRACRKVLDSQQTLDELVSRIAKCESLQEETEWAVVVWLGEYYYTTGLPTKP